jgi:peptidyl-prolyl cis-trans isomerase SurA
VETTEKFLTLLEEQGLTEQEARAAVSDQLKVDQLITQEAAIEEPTGQELRELYDSLVQQQAGGGTESGAESGGGPDVPPFEEVEPQLAQQLEQEKETEAIERLLKDLRAEANIVVNL